MTLQTVSDVKIITSYPCITFKVNGFEWETMTDNQEDFERFMHSIFQVWDQGGITIDQACIRTLQDNFKMLLEDGLIAEVC